MGIARVTMFFSLPSLVISALFLFLGQNPAPAPTPPGGLDPTVVAALIGLGGVVVGALIAGAVSVYQAKKTARVEKQRQDELFQHEKAMEQYRRLLEKQERSEENEEKRQEAAQLAMLRARTLEERVDAYRQALRADPLLARLQILDMTQPLAVTDIYVRLRVHQDTRSVFQVDGDAIDAEKRHDPNLLLQFGRDRLEQRAATALTPEVAIHTYKRCVVVGDPGAGKSTLLKHLALLAGEQKLTDLPNMPLHIELSAFASSKDRDLLGFAATVWEERYGFPKAEALDYFRVIFQQGQALLLCDALDETVTGMSREEAEASYLRVSQAITTLATRYPLVPIVVTARKAGYHQRVRLAGFTEVEVLDFRQEDIIQFVQRWFTLHQQAPKQSNAADLIAKLQRNPRIQALAANPLLLTLITLVYQDQLDLPERRAELYKQCLDILLTKWDASRNIRRLRAFKPEHKRRLLEEIAWHFHLQGQRYFPEAELLEHIATFLPAIGLVPEQNSQVLAEIAAENGLLKEQAHGWHGFLHLTLQEYCVAQYVAEHQQLEVVFARRDSPWWEEVLLLYAGRVSDASGLLQRLLKESEPSSETDRREVFETDLLLAGRCLAAAAVVKQATLRQNIITRLFSLLQSSPYTLTQKHTAETLAEIGGTTVQAQLVALLSNEQVDSDVRGSIADALGALGERSVAPQLVGLLSNEQVNVGVRGSIADALGALGERSVAPQLVALLSNEQVDSDVRERIAEALDALGERSVASQLVELLSNEQVDSDVRRSIAEALGALGERSVAPQLVGLLSNEQVDSYVRERIARTLGVLGERSMAPHLMALLSNKQVNIGLCGRIAEALGALGERSVAPQLMALLSNEQMDSSVRERIAEALGALGERSVASQLMALLSNEQVDSSVRERIAEALGALGERSVAPQLVGLLSNEQVNTTVRGNIAEALGTLGERSVAPQLVALLSNKQVNFYMRGRIAEALGTLGERSVAPQLVALLPNEQVNFYVRGRIARTLGTLGERSVAPQLMTVLSDEQVDRSVRQRIATILSSLVESDEHVSLLAALLFMPDIADQVHATLWSLSRQFGLRLFIHNGPGGQHVEVVKMDEASTSSEK